VATWPGSGRPPDNPILPDGPASGGLAGRVALVTGGNRGIGRAAAIGLAGAGADVAIAARDASVGTAACRHVRALGRRGEFFRCDVRSSKEVEATTAMVVERFGGLDILVTSAGVAPEETRAESTSDEEWARIVDTNLTGAFLCCRAAGRHMLAAGSGVIINIASVAAEAHLPGQIAYCASKAGVVALTRGLAQEWGPHGVRVVAVAPGYVQTDMNRDVWEPLAPFLDARGRLRDAGAARLEPKVSRAREIYTRTVTRTPLGRYGRPEEVAALIVLLASDSAAFATGTTFHIDGGYLARP
jgi:NAD(P)-dependent dehydrogenase (short-subunit alcohol dehydrogenase family)